jgi:hypothetical protein
MKSLRDVLDIRLEVEYYLPDPPQGHVSEIRFFLQKV